MVLYTCALDPSLKYKSRSQKHVILFLSLDKGVRACVHLCLHMRMWKSINHEQGPIFLPLCLKFCSSSGRREDVCDLWSWALHPDFHHLDATRLMRSIRSACLPVSAQTLYGEIHHQHKSDRPRYSWSFLDSCMPASRETLFLCEARPKPISRVIVSSVLFVTALLAAW